MQLFSATYFQSESGASRPEAGRDRVLSSRPETGGTTEPLRVSALAGDARWRERCDYHDADRIAWC